MPVTGGGGGIDHEIGSQLLARVDTGPATSFEKNSRRRATILNESHSAAFIENLYVRHASTLCLMCQSSSSRVKLNISIPESKLTAQPALVYQAKSRATSTGTAPAATSSLSIPGKSLLTICNLEVEVRAGVAIGEHRSRATLEG